VDEIESVMHELGLAFVAGLTQPGSMQAASAQRSRWSQTYDAAGARTLVGRWGRDLDAALDVLTHRVLRENGTTGVCIVEVSGDEAGNYTVSCSGDLPSLPFRLVLDDSYRYPHHPRPGLPKPAAADNDGRPTDPEVLAEVRGLVAEFTRHHVRLNGKPPRFEPGYGEAEILAVENQLGVRLPEDVRALYRTIHHDVESGLLGRFSPAPLEQLVTWYQEGEPGAYGWNDDLFAYDPVVFETHPHGHVRRLSRSDWWVTFAPDHGMNFAVLDLDPGPLGSYGQILTFGRDVWGPIGYVAPSIRHLMRQVIDSMRAAAPGEEEWDAGEWDAPSYEWLVDVDGRSVGDLVATLADPPTIQAVHLRQVDEVRLVDLAALPNLRSVRVLDVRRKARFVDLSLPAGSPVEQLHVAAERFDTRQLENNPHLRYLTLAGNDAPVSVAALARLPHLVRLDLAEATVADISAVAAFPALRVLTLNAGQWGELLHTGWSPEGLAGAEVAGRTSVPEATRWLTRIRGTSHAAARHRTIHHAS
jgi:cell wall assembly regulator SMI1